MLATSKRFFQAEICCRSATWDKDAPTPKQRLLTLYWSAIKKTVLKILEQDISEQVNILAAVVYISWFSTRDFLVTRLHQTFISASDVKLSGGQRFEAQ